MAMPGCPMFVWTVSTSGGASAHWCPVVACTRPIKSPCRRTWMNNWDRRYTDRVQLLVEILPLLAREPGFALKGGTAINLFERDLPRLSVDIDLTWLPVRDYAHDVRQIEAAL